MENKTDSLIKVEKERNESLISTLQMLKGIIEKKEYDLLNMSDKEKLEAKLMKDEGVL